MIRKAARNALALVCLLIGIAGLFLPFIQGIAMIVLAVFIADFEAKERLLERYRHTRIGGWLWERHEARKARERLDLGLQPAPPVAVETVLEPCSRIPCPGSDAPPGTSAETSCGGGGR